MKCEPHGTLNLNTKNAEQLGIQNVLKQKLQLISNLIIFKPKSHVKATPTCLQMPIIPKKNYKNIQIQKPT